MVRLTMIARVSDGLPLAEGLDRDEDPEMRQYDYKSQAKASAQQLAAVEQAYPVHSCLCPRHAAACAAVHVW
jgi:hypothetical protein